MGQIEEVIKALKWEIPLECKKIKYIPDDEELMKVKEIGKELGKLLLDRS